MGNGQNERQGYRLCTRCVMDTSDPQILFDNEGQCNNCTRFLATLSKNGIVSTDAGESLARLFEKVRAAGRGKEYDCVLGISGGVDSSYAAYLCKENGLRPLAVHMDNGWDSEESVINIKNVISKLDIDYQSFVLDWEEFRNLQLAFLRASVPEAETPTDVAIPAALHQIAAEQKIQYIVSAGNFATEGMLPKSWHYNAKDLKYLSHIFGTFGFGTLRSFPTFEFRRELYYKLAKRIRFVYPLNYASVSEDDMALCLVNKFGYRRYGEKHHESRYTRFIQSYYLLKKFGIDYRRATFSAKICSGQATREHALEVLETKPYDEEQIAIDKKYIATKLEISPEELERIIELPPKWYWDYPNDDRKLRYIYNIYRSIFRG